MSFVLDLSMSRGFCASTHAHPISLSDRNFASVSESIYMVKGTNIKPHIKNIPRRIQYGYN